MALLGVFSTKPLIEQAGRLVAVFADSCPPPRSGDLVVSEKKVQQALDALYRDAEAFATEQRLGVLRRARFAKAFQDELAKRGYRGDLVAKITTALTASALIGASRTKTG